MTARPAKTAYGVRMKPVEELDAEGLREVLLAYNGNVSKAATALGVDSGRLRRLVLAVPRLRGVLAEVLERGTDTAVDVLLEVLDDHANVHARFGAAKTLLQSEYGRARGFGPGDARERLSGAGRPSGSSLGRVIEAPEVTWLVEEAKKEEEAQEGGEESSSGASGSGA